MSEEEYIRNKLDRFIKNGVYGIPKEDNKMKDTSVQEINNVKEMYLTIEKSSINGDTKVIIGAITNDDVFAFHFFGDGCDMFANKWLNMVGEKVYKDDLKSEKKMLKKEINKLNQQLHQVEDDNRRYEEKIKNLEHADMLDKEAADYWSKEHDTLSERFAKLQEENKKLKDKVEHVEPFRALERTIREKHELKKELALEKAANEAQRKFIQSYAGKGTEVQFNYAIDEVKEVSYVIMDKEEYNKNFEKWVKMQSEQNSHKNTRADILDQAKKCVCGQREQDYGTPESNFQLIADLWNGYLGLCENGDGEPIFSIKSITPTDVAMMMALLKIARIRNGGGSGDSFVDLAGYAACGGEIWHGRNA